MAKYSGSSVTTVNMEDTPYNGNGTISGLADGGWLVTWTDDTYEHRGTFQQRYDASGERIGGETQVRTGLGSEPLALSDGGWLSIEYAPQSNGVTDSLYLQRYDADGNAVGGGTLINDYVQNIQLSTARVTELADGGSVVTWARSVSNDQCDIRQQRFDADGNKMGSETLVSSNSNWYQRNSQVTALSNGGWVVNWTGGTENGGIYQRVYGADDLAVGDEQRVRKYTPYETPSYYEAIATGDGGWLLVWNHYNKQKDSYDLLQQRYDAEGQATVTQIVTDIGPDVAGLNVTPLDNGGWAVASIHFQNSRYEVRLQVFDKSGEALGREITVDKNAASSNSGGPQVEALGDGRFVVVWESWKKGSTDTEIKQEIFSPIENNAPTANGEKITVDEDQKVVLDVLVNDRDKDHDKLTVESVSVVSGQADIEFSKNGRVTLKGLGEGLVDGETGSVVIQYEIYDGYDYDKARIEVTVNGITNPGDEIFGTAKGDVIVGKNFWEQLFGEGGNDMLDGRGGSDILYGGGGSDTLIGSTGDDTFIGGRGDDLLIGGGYNDSDRFVFHTGDGNDTIKNLRNGKIDLSALHEFRDLEDLGRHIHQHKDSVVIDLVGDNSITLANSSIHSLSRDDFII
jgi:hypothetical protein